MADLNIVRVGSLEGDDEPSYVGQESYNSWRYADEASLYSIAEDSRENQSASRASSSQVPPPIPAQTLESQEPDIEVQWVTAAEMEAEQGGDQYDNGVVPMPHQDPDEVESDEESLGPRHNARRSLLFLLLLGCAAVVIVLSLTLALRNRDSRPPTTVSGGIADPETPKGGIPLDPDSPANTNPTEGPPVTTTTTTSATTGVTPTTPFTPVVIDVRSLVWDAVTSCPQTNADDLTNVSRIQMEVFEEIIYEVESLVTTDANGSQSLDSKVGKGWILEKWALLMLFFETEGEFWIQLDNWYSYEDICLWYNQAADDENSHCISRPAGGAALTKLKLASNNLQGLLPKEICCLPTLKELVLNNNGLEGVEPLCVYEMGLDTLDLMGNDFDQVAMQSLETP